MPGWIKGTFDVNQSTSRNLFRFKISFHNINKRMGRSFSRFSIHEPCWLSLTQFLLFACHWSLPRITFSKKFSKELPRRIGLNFVLRPPQLNYLFIHPKNSKGGMSFLHIFAGQICIEQRKTPDVKMPTYPFLLYQISIWAHKDLYCSRSIHSLVALFLAGIRFSRIFL